MRSARALRDRSIFFLSAFLLAGECLAQIDCLKAPEPSGATEVRQQIHLKRQPGRCYEDVKTHAPDSVASGIELIDKAAKEQSAADRQRAVAGFFDFIGNWLQANVRDTGLRDAVQAKLSEARAAFVAGELSKSAANPVSWSVVSRPGGILTSNVYAPADLLAPISKNCTGDRNACAIAIADVEAVLRTHGLVTVALGVARKSEVVDLANLYEKRVSMWDAYRTEARPQYPWEWLVNGVLYSDDRRTDAAGNPIGPANLPKGQVILLHPGVGLERFNARATGQSSDNPTLYLEWIGYNRLDWNYEEGKLRGGVGVSFISVYAARQDAKDWSRGVMFWVSNKYGLAVTRNDAGTSLMLSVDLGELYRDKLDQINQAVRSFPK